MSTGGGEGQGGWIDYSTLTGHVTSFQYEGRVWFDIATNVQNDDWKEMLVKAVIKYRLNVDYGHGLTAFVYPLLIEGLVERINFDE